MGTERKPEGVAVGQAVREARKGRNHETPQTAPRDSSASPLAGAVPGAVRAAGWERGGRVGRGVLGPALGSEKADVAPQVRKGQTAVRVLGGPRGSPGEGG